jgi:hypothetical protein
MGASPSMPDELQQGAACPRNGHSTSEKLPLTIIDMRKWARVLSLPEA